MDKVEFTRNITGDALALLSYEENPEFVGFFQALASKEDSELESPFDIATQLRCMKPLPQVIWDFIIELYEYEIANRNCDAMNDLGSMYYDGTGCDQSFEKALYYYQLAAQNGSRQAQENLGYCYYYGRNTPVDYAKAFHYFALGAFDGHLISLYKIGDMYANGLYVPKNEKEAFCIYNHCAEMISDNNAKYVAGPIFLRLGNAYLHGLGVEPDPEVAHVCYQKAEVFLYDMVKNGNVMYKKSLQAAIDGQIQSRKKMLNNIPDNVWPFD